MTSKLSRRGRRGEGIACAGSARLHLARVINQAILTLAGPGVGVAEAIVVAVGVRVWGGKGKRLPAG